VFRFRNEGMPMFHSLARCLALSAVLLSAASVQAADEGEVPAEAGESGPIDVSVTVTAVSDYRFRGVSLTNKDPAFQPAITISHESGLYVGAWASNISENAGSDSELDVFAGFAGGDALTYDVGFTYYLYPGVSSANYAELTGKLGTTIGPVQLGAMLAYAPSQDGTGNADNIYAGGNASLGIPTTPLKINASLGFEDGAFGDKKVDWSLGVTADIAGFTLGASYVDTNRFVGGLGKAGAVFSVSYGF
jgi:uncharacterized protein (TIGR02001 family)